MDNQAHSNDTNDEYTQRDDDKPDIKLDDSERQPCEVWTRVMGYYRPVSVWNIGKQSEYKERIPFQPASPAIQRKLNL